MTEKNQDERLAQLMAEFAGQKTESTAEKQVDPGQEEIYESQSEQSQNIEKLRTQIQELQEEIFLQRETNAQNNNAEELTTLQQMYVNHASKIETLEQKHQLLTADVEVQSEKKRDGFGAWGWVFLCSNVLLWSVLGWFLWAHYRGDFINENSNSNVLANENSYDGLSPIEEEYKSASASLQNVESTVNEDVVASTNQDEANLEDENSTATPVQNNAASNKNTTSSVERNNTNVTGYNPDKYKGLTQAQIYYKKLREENSQSNENSTVRFSESNNVDKNSSNTNSESQPTGDNQPVRFGE